MKDNKNFEIEVINYLSERIDFLNSEAKSRHFKKCIHLLFEYKQLVVNRQDYISAFNRSRDQVIFNIIPSIYIDSMNNKMENAHSDFVNDLNSIILEHEPPPHFWQVNEEQFIDKDMR